MLITHIRMTMGLYKHTLDYAEYACYTYNTQNTQKLENSYFLEVMSYLQFKQGWEKLKRAPCKVEVLKLMLAGNTDAEIAKSRNRAPGTIRKQISQIYRDFGIESEFPGDQSQRDKLKDLFQQYKPEWVAEYDSTVTSQVSEEGGQENQSNNSLAISSSRKDEGLILSAIPILEAMSRDNSISIASSNKGEELMLMATKILDELDVDQVFQVKKHSQYTGYRPKNPQEGYDRYLLIFFQQEESLSISIAQDILEPYLLTLKYWKYIDSTMREVDSYIAGRFLVLPTKKEIFLNSLHHNYWNLLEIERKTVGTFYLNELETFHSEFGIYCSPLPSLILNEFAPYFLSDSDSYLILDEDKRFAQNYQVCISSSTVLQDFLSYFGKVLLDQVLRSLDEISGNSAFEDPPQPPLIRRPSLKWGECVSPIDKFDYDDIEF